MYLPDVTIGTEIDESTSDTINYKTCRLVKAT